MPVARSVMFATATLEGATESREPKLAEIVASTGAAATVAALSCVPVVGTRRNEKERNLSHA